MNNSRIAVQLWLSAFERMTLALDQAHLQEQKRWWSSAFSPVGVLNESL